MKTKSIILSAIFAVFTLSAFAQLKVDQFGRIGMGTNWPNPGYKCHIAGNLLCTSYPANPYYELQLIVGNGWPGCEIGATSDIVAFWSGYYLSYHELRASNFIKMSDSTTKSNILPIENGLERVLKLRAVSYSTEDNKIDGSTGKEIPKEKAEFGFLSQQVRDLFPEVNITVEDHNKYVLLDYDQIVPIAVSAIQEQQKIIDSLKNELTIMKEQINSNSSLNINNNNTFNEQNQNVLNQNTPNPFNQKTEIKFQINEENFRNASIVIFDMNGLLIKKYEIQKSGDGSVEINGNELKAGMYIYTLIVNQKEIDSKRMILLN